MVQPKRVNELKKNRSFRKVAISSKEEDFNLYGNSNTKNLEQVKRKFNLTGELKQGNLKTEAKDSESKGNRPNKANLKNKGSPQTMNIYNLIGQGSPQEEKQPIQLMKTRSKNASFLKKKVASFNEPAKKHFQIDLYGSKITLLLNTC